MSYLAKKILHLGILGFLLVGTAACTAPGTVDYNYAQVKTAASMDDLTIADF